MKFFILTSDNYSFLTEGYMQLFNNYWTPAIDVTILGFKEPEVNLLDNFSFESLGKQEEWDTWSGPLLKYFNALEEEYFFLCFEDHYIVDTVNSRLFSEGVSYLHEEPKVDKIYLLPDPRVLKGRFKGSFYTALTTKGTLLASSLLPAVWRREFFIESLHPDLKTPHEFEAYNNSRDVDANIIYANQIIYPVVDAVRGGKYNMGGKWGIDTQVANTGFYDQGCYRQPVSTEAIKIYQQMYDKWNAR